MSGEVPVLVPNVLNCIIVVSKFKLQSHKYVHFQTNHHHHHVVPLARISLTLSRHSPYHSSPLVGLQGYIPYLHIAAECMFELVVLLLPGHMWGVHRSTSLMSLSLLLQQCPACLVRLTWIVFMMGGRWPYSWCLVACCHQDLLNIQINTLVKSMNFKIPYLLRVK